MILKELMKLIETVVLYQNIDNKLIEVMLKKRKNTSIIREKIINYNTYKLL